MTTDTNQLTGISNPATGIPTPSSSSFNISDLLGDIGTGLLDFGKNAVSGIKDMGAYAPEIGAGIYFANQAQADTDKNVAKLDALGRPYVNAGNAALTDPSAAIGAQNRTTIDQNTNLNDIAKSSFQNYQNGTLSPADEQRVQQYLSGQKQQLRQSLGGNVDSSVLAQYDAQIDSGALQMRQDLLTKQYQVGIQAQQEVQQTFSTMFNQAISLGQAGMQPIIDGIQLAVQSDTDIANALQGLLGSIAEAYGRQHAAGSGTGQAQGQGAASGAGGGSNIANQLRNLLGNGSAAGGDISGIANIAPDMTDWFGGANGYDFSGVTMPSFDFGGVDPSGSVGIQELGDSGNWTDSFQGLGSSIADFSSAGGQAASGIGSIGGDLGGVNSVYDLNSVQMPQLGGVESAGRGALGTAAGGLAAAYSAYNMVDQWESGDTAGNTLRGAQTGAAIGSIVPGIGTLVGAGVGAVVGAVSSLFGGGKQSDADKYWDVFKGHSDANGASIPHDAMQHMWGGGYGANAKLLSPLSNALTAKYGKGKDPMWNYQSFIVDTLAQAQKGGTNLQGMSQQQLGQLVSKATAQLSGGQDPTAATNFAPLVAAFAEQQVTGMNNDPSNWLYQAMGNKPAPSSSAAIGPYGAMGLTPDVIAKIKASLPGLHI